MKSLVMWGVFFPYDWGPYVLLTEDQPPWVETAFLCHVSFDGRSLLPVTETKELLFLEANPFSNHTVKWSSGVHFARMFSANTFYIFCTQPEPWLLAESAEEECMFIAGLVFCQSPDSVNFMTNNFSCFTKLTICISGLFKVF